ncbi:hypothetical protein EON83_25870 [bacterium]|nr:MAG: hypothetical protein EON83_25870 [bacterium]
MKSPNQHNYLKHLFDLHASELKEGTVTTVAVAHDDWCQIFKGGKCNCNPTLTTTATRPNRSERRKNR